MLPAYSIIIARMQSPPQHLYTAATIPLHPRLTPLGHEQLSEPIIYEHLDTILITELFRTALSHPKTCRHVLFWEKCDHPQNHIDPTNDHTDSQWKQFSLQSWTSYKDSSFIYYEVLLMLRTIHTTWGYFMYSNLVALLRAQTNIAALLPFYLSAMGNIMKANNNLNTEDKSQVLESDNMTTTMNS
jgi:hypothetical protein